jgi:microcystin-dependent protein
LFSLIGTTYGGNGRTDFGIPDLRGRVGVGYGQGPGMLDKRIGQQYGMEEYRLDQSQMPSHSHALAEKIPGQSFDIESTAVLYANKSNNDSATPENAFSAPAKVGPKVTNAYATTYDTTMNSSAVSVQTTGEMNVNNLQIGLAGGTESLYLAQPTLVLNFAICLVGTYPSRD